MSTKYYLNKINKFKLAISEFYSPVMYSSCLKNNVSGCDDIVILHTQIDFEILFQNNEIDEHLFSGMWCGYYDTNMEKREGYFIDVLNYFTDNNKTILVYVDFVNYLIDHDVQDKLEYATHSTLSIYYPDNSNYKVYHFNSHGIATENSDWIYNKILSRTRYKEIQLDAPLDYHVISKFINFINKHETTDITYHYNHSDECNYKGPNLQKGDNIGICFVFPFILCCNFIDKFRESTKVTSKNKDIFRVNSFYKLLNNNQIDKIIYTTMSYFIYDFIYLVKNKDINNESIETISNTISLSQKYGAHFTRHMLKEYFNLIHY